MILLFFGMKLHELEQSSMKCNCSSNAWDCLWEVEFEDLSGTFIQLKLLDLSGQPLTFQFFFSDIVWQHGSVFTIKFTLLNRWHSKSFIYPGQLAQAKQNALLNEMFPTTQ